MSRANLHKLWAFLLISTLLVAPASALPADTEISTSWWQTSLDSFLSWILVSSRSTSQITGSQSDDGPAMPAEALKAVAASEPHGERPNGNSYPGLDPNGYRLEDADLATGSQDANSFPGLDPNG